MAANWHYANGGEKHGPITASQLKELATTGKLSPDDLVWREDMKEWRKASTVKGLFPEDHATTLSVSPPQSSRVESTQQQSIWEQPVVITLLFIIFWPAGAYLLWKKLNGKSGTPVTVPSIPKKWLFIGGGSMAALMVFGTILIVMQTSASRKEIAEAARLWEQGKHNEAVAIYQSVITSRGPFIPSDQKPLVYGRVIDHLTESGRQQEARHVLENLNKLATPVTPLVESESGRQLLAEIRRQKEAEKQKREAEEQREKEQQALAAAARNPVTLDKSGRADFLDNTASYKGKAIRTECEWIGGGLRSRSTGRMTVLEVDVWHTSGLFHVNVRVPEELEIPNIQSGDDLVITFLCEQGRLNTGNTALKVERRE
jgi:hypothetical protein